MTTTEHGATDHRGLRLLTLEDCLDRLRSTHVGRLGFVSAGEPVVFPLNHAVDGQSVVFRTREGSKLDAAVGSAPVVYEADSYDEASATGWSVMVKGTAEVVYDDADVRRYDALGLRSWADPESGGQWVRVRAVEVSGREIAR
jgi:uncharacterized protein